MKKIRGDHFSHNPTSTNTAKIHDPNPSIKMSILQLTDNNSTISTVTTNDARSDQVKLRRKRFLIFVKILFRLLQRAGEERLLEQAKRIVAQCRHNTSPHYLDRTIAKELKSVVGDHFFMKATRLLTIYLRRRQKEHATQHQQASTAMAPTINTNRRHGTAANFDQQPVDRNLFLDVLISIEQFINRRDLAWKPHSQT